MWDIECCVLYSINHQGETDCINSSCIISQNTTLYRMYLIIHVSHPDVIHQFMRQISQYILYNVLCSDYTWTINTSGIDQNTVHSIECCVEIYTWTINTSCETEHSTLYRMYCVLYLPELLIHHVWDQNSTFYIMYCEIILNSPWYIRMSSCIHLTVHYIECCVNVYTWTINTWWDRTQHSI